MWLVHEDAPTMTEQSTFSESEPEVYQSVSRAAVASALLGLFGLGAFFFPTLVVLSLIGVVFAVIHLIIIVRLHKYTHATARVS